MRNSADTEAVRTLAATSPEFESALRPLLAADGNLAAQRTALSELRSQLEAGGRPETRGLGWLRSVTDDSLLDDLFACLELVYGPSTKASDTENLFVNDVVTLVTAAIREVGGLAGVERYDRLIGRGKGSSSSNPSGKRSRTRCLSGRVWRPRRLRRRHTVSRPSTATVCDPCAPGRSSDRAQRSCAGRSMPRSPRSFRCLRAPAQGGVAREVARRWRCAAPSCAWASWAVPASSRLSAPCRKFLRGQAARVSWVVWCSASRSSQSLRSLRVNFQPNGSAISL